MARTILDEELGFRPEVVEAQLAHSVRDPAGECGYARIKPPETRAAWRRPAITDPAKVRELMCAIEGYGGYRVSQAALRLAPLVFVRPGELRKAQWPDEPMEQLTSKL